MQSKQWAGHSRDIISRIWPKKYPFELVGVQSDDIASSGRARPVTCSIVTCRVAARILTTGNDANNIGRGMLAALLSSLEVGGESKGFDNGKFCVERNLEGSTIDG